jgi:Zn finger protein HypA/HybF involved in hydrogenase expression
MDPLMLDGNAAAGVLQEIFSVEMTTAVETCAGCGSSDELGAAHLYRGAGLVLRCPSCKAILLTIVTGRERACVDLRGVSTLELHGHSF